MKKFIDDQGNSIEKGFYRDKFYINSSKYVFYFTGEYKESSEGPEALCENQNGTIFRNKIQMLNSSPLTIGFLSKTLQKEQEKINWLEKKLSEVKE